VCWCLGGRNPRIPRKQVAKARSVKNPRMTQIITSAAAAKFIAFEIVRAK